MAASMEPQEDERRPVLQAMLSEPSPSRRQDPDVVFVDIASSMESCDGPRTDGRKSMPTPASMVSLRNTVALESPAMPNNLTRAMTWHDAAKQRKGRRWEAAELRPEAIAQLHKLNEAFLRYSGPEAPRGEDASDAALAAFWGPRGSWSLVGDCPAGRESAFSVRGFRALPPSRAGGASAMLRSFGAAAINSKGRKGAVDSAPGQDNLSLSHLASGWEVLCVMDGHGRAGQWPSTRAVRTMPFFLGGRSCSRMLRHGRVEAALQHAFDKVQMDLKQSARREQVDLQATGCTAACIVWHPSLPSIWAAWAGDSRAVLFSPERGIIHQTEDHKPCVESEVERIHKQGGEVVCTEFDDGFVEYRVNLKGEDYPGISMTRSLGDLVVKDAGVIAAPQVATWPKIPGSMVLAASDGVWEFMSTEVVVDMVLQSLAAGHSRDEAIQEVLKKARAAWEDHEGVYCDDISMLIAAVDAHTPEPASRSGCGSGRAILGHCSDGLCRSAPGGCNIA